MIVGIMTNFNKPTKLAKMTALISKSYGIEVIYLRINDVNIKKGKVKGRVLIDNKWVRKETDIPPFIDISIYCFKKENEKITDYLKKHSYLSDNRKNVFRKRALQNHLKHDSDFSHLVIPTHRIKNYKILLDYVEQYTKVVLKPSGGIRGKGIYILEKMGENYTLGHGIEENQLNDDELRKFFNERIVGKGYVLQNYISSRTLQGDPFDCRIHVEKNGNGKWEIARNYIRIGIGQKVISNVNQGGGISNPEPFLKANFGQQWQEINHKLNELARTLPYRMEQLRGTHIMSMGLDIGIDKDGKLYLFEINDGPDTSAVIAEVAFLRSNYYKYVLKHKLEIWKEEPKIDYEKYKKILNKTKKLQAQIKLLEKDINFYKKNNDKKKNSTSWKLTAPVRKIGSIKKKFGKKNN